MAQPSDFEARLSAVEGRVEVAAADAAAARHLAVAHDRDLAELPVKVDANRAAINALGVQTAARFDQMDARFEQVDARFEQVDARFDQVDARFEQVDARLRDLAELPVKVDANRAAINALGVQTAARFLEVDARFEQVDVNFAEVRARLDQAAAGQRTIVDMLTVLIDRQDG